MTRSMSRWKQVRVGQGGMSAARPFDWVDRQARGESVRRSSSSVRSRMVTVHTPFSQFVLM